MLAAAPDVSTNVGRSASGLRNRLRDATGEAHRELDAQFTAFDLTGISGYRRFLQANAAALLPLEDALVAAGVAGIFPDWPERARSASIVADLQRLGLGLPSAIPVPPLSRNGVLGTMYVLEGSRLGAKFLLKAIADAPDSRIAQAAAYLGHGIGKRLWQSFLARLADEHLSERDEAEAVGGAQAAFAAFERAADRA